MASLPEVLRAACRVRGRRKGFSGSDLYGVPLARSLCGICPSERDSVEKERRLVRRTRISTPLGDMIACATERALYLLEFADRRMLET